MAKNGTAQSEATPARAAPALPMHHQAALAKGEIDPAKLQGLSVKDLLKLLEAILAVVQGK